MTPRTPRVGVPVVVVGAAATALAGFLPWGASGRRERTSYELVGVLDRLDVLDGVWAGLARAWYLAPLVAAAVLLAAAFGRHRIAVGLALALAALATVLALAVRSSPLLTRSGPTAALVAAAAVVAGVLSCVVERGSAAKDHD